MSLLFSAVCVCSSVYTWVPRTGYKGASQCLASVIRPGNHLYPEVLALHATQAQGEVGHEG